MLANEEQCKLIRGIFESGKKLTYSRGEYIIRPGETPNGVFFIDEGVVKLYDITKYGEENLLSIRTKGDLMGITRAVSGTNRNIIYVTLSPTTVYVISNDQFTNFLRQNPAACLPIIDMLTVMYHVNTELIMTLEYRTVRERLASFLISMTKRFGTKTPYGTMIGIPLRHQDIASSISATRETTSRTVGELERKGILMRSQSHITVRDISTLQSLIE